MVARWASTVYASIMYSLQLCPTLASLLYVLYGTRENVMLFSTHIKHCCVFVPSEMQLSCSTQPPPQLPHHRLHHNRPPPNSGHPLSRHHVILVVGLTAIVPLLIMTYSERREHNRREVHALVDSTKSKMQARRARQHRDQTAIPANGVRAVGGAAATATTSRRREQRHRRAEAAAAATPVTADSTTGGASASTDRHHTPTQDTTPTDAAAQGPLADTSAVTSDSSYLNEHNLQRLRAQASARQQKVGDSPPQPSRGVSLERRSPTRPRTAARAGATGNGDGALQAPQKQATPPLNVKDGRVADLVGFLDSVDEKQSRIEAELGGLESERTLRAASVRSSHAHDDAIDPAHAETAATVTKLILQQQLELKEKDAAIASLERRLVEQAQAAQAARSPRTTPVQAGTGSGSGGDGAVFSLEEQLKEANLTINRHLKFIDRLIQDKKGLSERCEQLVNQVKEADSAYVALA